MAGLAFLALIWAVMGTLTGLLAWRKRRNPLVWGLVGGSPFLGWGIPALLVLAFLPFLCPKCKSALSNAQRKAGECERCEEVTAGIELAQPSRPWRWIALATLAITAVAVYAWSTTSVRRSVEGFCDSLATGDPVAGIEDRGRAAGLTVYTAPAGSDQRGQSRDALILAARTSPFFYVYNCFVYHANGKVTSKHAAGGAL